MSRLPSRGTGPRQPLSELPLGRFVATEDLPSPFLKVPAGPPKRPISPSALLSPSKRRVLATEGIFSQGGQSPARNLLAEFESARPKPATPSTPTAPVPSSSRLAPSPEFDRPRARVEADENYFSQSSSGSATLPPPSATTSQESTASVVKKSTDDQWERDWESDEDEDKENVIPRRAKTPLSKKALTLPRSPSKGLTFGLGISGRILGEATPKERAKTMPMSLTPRAVPITPGKVSRAELLARRRALEIEVDQDESWVDENA